MYKRFLKSEREPRKDCERRPPWQEQKFPGTGHWCLETTIQDDTTKVGRSLVNYTRLYIQRNEARSASEMVSVG